MTEDEVLHRYRRLGCDLSPFLAAGAVEVAEYLLIHIERAMGALPEDGD